MLHPEVKRASSEQMKAVRRGEIISSRQPSFADDTAQKASITPRTVQQEVQIATKITPEVKVGESLCPFLHAGFSLITPLPGREHCRSFTLHRQFHIAHARGEHP